MPKDFTNTRPQLGDPADDMLLIVPNADPMPLAQAVRAIRANGAGNVRLRTPAGTDVVCAFAAGETRPIRATHVWQTGTTATGLEGHI